MISTNRPGRLAATCAVTFLLAVTVWAGGPTAGAQDQPTPLELNGAGTGMVSGFLNSWAVPLYASSAGLSLSYFAMGSRDGRASWARGDDDFAITGRPLTDADRASLKARGVSAIEAPIAVSAMVMLLAPPVGNPLQVQYAEGEGDDAIYIKTPWAGPVTMTNDLVSRIMLEKSEPLGNESTFTAQIPQIQPSPSNPTPLPVTLVSGQRPVLPVVRSDPGATDYYLEQFIKASSPGPWASKLAELKVPASTLSENWPFLTTPSRSGDDQLGQLVGGWFSPDGSTYSIGGTMAPVSPSTATAERLKQLAKSAASPPQQPTVLYNVALQNGSGAYVQPTTDTITKAAALSNGVPLGELSDLVAPADAYPLTWVSNLEVQSSGLPIDKTTAIATLIRYSVTEGQKAAAGLGEGTLPAPLVTQALTAANDVVVGNCTGSDRKVVQSADGGQYWPTGVAPPVGGAYVCVSTATPGAAVSPATVKNATIAAPVRAESTTTAPALPRSSAVAPYVAPSSYAGSPLGSDELGKSAESAGAPPVNTSNSAAKVDSAVLATATLPLALPGDGRNSLDRLSTMLLGGVAFLIARGLFRRRRLS